MKPEKIILEDGVVEEMWKSGEAMMNEARYKKLIKENKRLRRALKRLIKEMRFLCGEDGSITQVNLAIKYAEKVLREGG